METIIRKATVKDVVQIHRLINHYAQQGKLLPRPLSELYEQVRAFFVMEQNKGSSPVLIGVSALEICWEDLAEVKALAVWEDYRHQKWGTRLVEACLAEARALGINKVFTLTYARDFFMKLGFREVEKNTLPHKIWTDCMKCPKFPECDETALLMEW